MIMINECKPSGGENDLPRAPSFVEKIWGLGLGGSFPLFSRPRSGISGLEKGSGSEREVEVDLSLCYGDRKNRTPSLLLVLTGCQRLLVHLYCTVPIGTFVLIGRFSCDFASNKTQLENKFGLVRRTQTCLPSLKRWSYPSNQHSFSSQWSAFGSVTLVHCQKIHPVIWYVFCFIHWQTCL
jgi:hypothetical protein